MWLDVTQVGWGNAGEILSVFFNTNNIVVRQIRRRRLHHLAMAVTGQINNPSVATIDKASL